VLYKVESAKKWNKTSLSHVTTTMFFLRTLHKKKNTKMPRQLKMANIQANKNKCTKSLENILNLAKEA
jgi:hypothetical protein